MINILLADDHKMVIDGLKALLSTEEDICIIGEVLNGNEVMNFLSNNGHKVHMIILDINMPTLDGIETTKLIRKKYPSIKILVLSMYNKPLFIKKLTEEGVSGYILKNTGKDDLIAAIRKIQSGEEYFSNEVTKAIMGSFRNSEISPEVQLTKRELEILRLLAKAHTTSEIADQLFLSPYTVDTHRKNLLSKLSLKNTAGLVKYAHENGLTEDKF